MPIKVSVIIPCYNGGGTIRQQQVGMTYARGTWEAKSALELPELGRTAREAQVVGDREATHMGEGAKAQRPT